MGQVRGSERRIVRLALAAWAVALLGVSLRVLLAPASKGTVVNIYLKAAEHWLAGENVYLVYPGLDLFRNPPVVAPLFLPLTLLPVKVAGLIWRWGMAAAFLFALRQFLHTFWPQASRSQRAWTFLLALPLALVSLNNGQMNLLVVAVLMGGASSVAEGRWHRGACGLGAAAGMKLYPGAIGLLLAGAYPRRILPAFLAVTLASALLPFGLQQPHYVSEAYRSLAWSLVHDVRSYDDPSRAPQDAFLILHSWGIRPGREIYLVLQVIVAFVMAAVIWALSRQPADGDEEARKRVVAWAFHLGCVWMTVFGPASEVPTYTLLAPSAAMLLATIQSTSSPSRNRFISGLGWLAYALLTAPILRDVFPHGAGFRNLGTMPAGGLLLLIVMTLHQRSLAQKHPNEGLTTILFGVLKPQRVFQGRRSADQRLKVRSSNRSAAGRHGRSATNRS